MNPYDEYEDMECYMKTPLPKPRYHQVTDFDSKVRNLPHYTEAQLKAAMVAAYREGVEDAAKVCDEQAAYERADKCAEEIRKLKE